MFVSDVSDFLFVGKVEPYFLSAGEEVVISVWERLTHEKIFHYYTHYTQGADYGRHFHSSQVSQG